MIVRVRYLAQLKQAAGLAVEEVTLAEGGKLEDLVPLLARHHPPLQNLLLDAGGRVQRTLLIFVDDEQANLERVLSAGDEVTLLTPIAGGEGTWQADGR